MYNVIKDKILNNRFFFMGIAIIFVVLYHYYCAVTNIQCLSIFKKGYIGVDIFFFFSGLGLGYSFTKNNLLQFYKNRIWRIFPLYLIWAIVHLIVISIQRSTVPSFWDTFGLFTSLSYYGVGSIRSNWYLSAIFLLYTVYPLLFTLTKKCKWIFLLIIVSLTFIIIYKTQLHWYHNVFIGRIYIFLLGIHFYQIINDNHRHLHFDLIAIIFISIIGLLSLFNGSHRFDYWGTNCLCPVVIGLLCMLPREIIDTKFIAFCGKYSLEIFIGNCWTMLLMNVLSNINCMNAAYESTIYFISNALFAVVLIYINKLFSQLHTKKENSMQTV